MKDLHCLILETRNRIDRDSDNDNDRDSDRHGLALRLCFCLTRFWAVRMINHGIRYLRCVEAIQQQERDNWRSWCLVTWSVTFFQIMRSVTQTRTPMSLALVPAAAAVLIGPEGEGADESIKHMAGLVLALYCHVTLASVHSTSTHQHDRQRTNLLLCLFCSSPHLSPPLCAGH
jgi:hypothetical protein